VHVFSIAKPLKKSAPGFLSQDKLLNKVPCVVCSLKQTFLITAEEKENKMGYFSLIICRE